MKYYQIPTIFLKARGRIMYNVSKWPDVEFRDIISY